MLVNKKKSEKILEKLEESEPKKEVTSSQTFETQTQKSPKKKNQEKNILDKIDSEKTKKQ